MLVKAKIQSRESKARIPESREWCIFLIKEELRNRRFTNGLDKLKLDTSACCSDLSKLILAFAGFKTQSEELSKWLFDLIDDYAEKFDLLDCKVLEQQALNVYRDIVEYKT